MARRVHLVIAGGGTSGHVFPALALADALCDLGYAKDEIGFVGSRRGMEGRFVTDAGYAIRLLPGRGLSSRIGLANLGSLLAMARQRPAVVVSVGGYAALPSSVAAIVLRVPIVVVNVDAVAGRANRAIGRFATLAAVGFAETALPRAVVTGAPVRREIETVTRDPSERSRSR